jgi:TatD DNase family protein
MSNTYAYPLGRGLYLNITNRCSFDCVFCVRHFHGDFNGHKLWLEREPTAGEVLAQIDALGGPGAWQEIVFCGFGEPTMALDVLLEVCAEIKKRGQTPIRLNTNGQASLIHGFDVSEKLQGLVDTVSVSLNAPDSEEYDAVCQPERGGVGFQAMLDFTAACRDRGMAVVMTVVDTIGAQKIARSRAIAEALGVGFRVRAYIDEE